ncbi:OmpH family outer membrane protein [Flavobacterium capsici]|uniref:OmpH family outer membrane protein n=1 Tax=Flavobacterium capsici TaxID=3075618 RepID=A0AA96EW03_9FLAO|nr:MULTISPECIES: OmpH family outer membrane protein [unclassified Flavobacterium]WNM19638.1 OmpH family outer membrane protein [Flavobacterium sp. PMR2A8]WNM21027.1 OmpH family outer membrane protein [Flavobacterium sp. PMTSA4]
MKKTITALAILFTLIACEKTTQTKEFKTAYIDTSKLMEESIEAKDIEAKYKEKSKTMGTQLEAEVNRWKSEAANFQKNAQANGQAWAQQKGAELQKREQQLSYAQEGILRQLQQESGAELDSLVTSYKKEIKQYGKEKGYDYIYGTGESNSVLFAKENYDITKEIIKIVNDKYKSTDNKEEKTEKKEEQKK